MFCSSCSSCMSVAVMLEGVHTLMRDTLRITVQRSNNSNNWFFCDIMNEKHTKLTMEVGCEWIWNSACFSESIIHTAMQVIHLSVVTQLRPEWNVFHFSSFKYYIYFSKYLLVGHTAYNNWPWTLTLLSYLSCFQCCHDTKKQVSPLLKMRTCL